MMIKGLIAKYGMVALKALVATLFISSLTLGYLYNNSLSTISDLRSQNNSLEASLEQSNRTVDRLRRERTIIESTERELQDDYKTIEQEFESLLGAVQQNRCIPERKEVQNETNTTDNDIRIDTYYRLLDRAHCLSTNSCNNP